MVETGVTEPRWVRAIEVRPGTVKGRKITHHANSDLIQDEPGEVTQAGPGRFMEWAVGKEGEIMRPNSGKLMLPGSTHRLGHPLLRTPTRTSPTSSKWASTSTRRVRSRSTGSICCAWATPATAPSTFRRTRSRPTESFYPLKQAARIESFQPHMHLRGKAMSLEAILPTGQTVMLSHVDNFNFNWHTAYVYADDAAPLVPKGTVMKITAWHDNTAANKANPDPNVWVGYGDRTVDEMAPCVGERHLPDR